MRVLLTVVGLWCVTHGVPAAESLVRVSADGKHFVRGESNTRLELRGFNYDHDETGRLLEDYWVAEWPKVEADFREMRELGANVVRVHLQVGRFLRTATEAHAEALAQLERLVKLAEREQLLLDVTGLGCYHKADVPVWYDELDEAGRWQAQAVFWKAIARTCRSSPAIFCYDIMNEPVVPGGKRNAKDWLGPPFAGKHFVQVITLDQQGRPRPEIARLWLREMVAAIRAEDPNHLVTVGLVDWSLDKPGLTSGFVPEKIAAELDFLCVHLYPEANKLDENLATLAAFAKTGKPLVIEETFPLKCSREEYATFLKRSREHSQGVISFYWGKTPAELRRSGTIGDAILLQAIETLMSDR